MASLKEEITQRAPLCLLLLIVFWSGLRFYGLDQSPPGFYIDESSTALNSICLNQRGESFFGERLPLFPLNLSGGHNSPTFTYFGAAWSRLFGYSVASFRAVPALAGVLALLGLFLLTRVMWGSTCALLCCLTLAASPWAFQSSRIYWDACLPLCFMPWGLYFLLRPGRIGSRIVSGIIFSLSMYSYGASRIQVPLLLIAIAAIPHFRRQIGWKGLWVVFGALFLTSLPLITYTLWGDGLSRYHQVGLGSRGEEKSLSFFLGTSLKNVLLHFDPSFLFGHGDKNLRHSTYFFGQLGWLDILAGVAGLGLLVLHLRSRKEKTGAPKEKAASILLSLVGIFTGILPAAVTWDSLPHALRSSGSAPFFAMLSGWVLWRTSLRFRFFIPGVAVLALFYTGVFTESYFVEYPRVAEGFFDSYIRQAIGPSSLGGTQKEMSEFLDENKNYHEAGLRYFLAAYYGVECKETKEKIAARQEVERAYAALRLSQSKLYSK